MTATNEEDADVAEDGTVDATEEGDEEEPRFTCWNCRKRKRVCDKMKPKCGR